MKRKKKGMILTETLVAIAAMATAAFAAATILNVSLFTTNISKDFLSANNLLLESSEIIKNIKDSNRLIYPNKPSCWLAVGGACDKIKNSLINGNFILSLTDGLWQLEDGPTNALNLANYNSSNVSDPQNGFRVKIGNQDSKYFRSIVFKSADDTSAEYEVLIQWKNGAKTSTLKKSVYIFNN